MLRNLKLLFVFYSLIFSISNVHSFQIPYDPEIEGKLSNTHTIRLVSQIKDTEAAQKPVEAQKVPSHIDLNLTFDGATKYDQGESHWCTFFARVCSMLLTDLGKAHLQSLFLGQDNNFVYIKYPTPRPFGIENTQQFLLESKLQYPQGFEICEFLKRTAFKVDKSIMFEHKPLSSFADVPPWFRHLAATYLDITNHIAGEPENEELLDNRGLLLTFGYCEDGSTSRKNSCIEIITGKEQTPKLNIKTIFDRHEFPNFYFLLGTPLLNFQHIHARALNISSESVFIFDSQSDEKSIVVSKMFDSRLSLDFIRKIIMHTQEFVSNYLQAVKDYNNAHSTDDQDEGLIEQIIKCKDQALDDISNATHKLLPTFDTYQPLTLRNLSPEEFFTRLYAELMQKCFFELQVLDL